MVYIGCVNDQDRSILWPGSTIFKMPWRQIILKMYPNLYLNLFELFGLFLKLPIFVLKQLCNLSKN